MPVDFKKLLTNLGLTDIKDLTSEFLQNTTREINNSYYSNLLTSIISDYKKLFPKVSNLEQIKEVLQENTLEEILNKVRAYNEKNELNPITFTEELHYSKYQGKLHFNQVLEGQINT
jgi:ribonuclease HIII